MAFNLKSGNNIGGRNGKGVLFKKMGVSELETMEEIGGLESTDLEGHKKIFEDIAEGADLMTDPADNELTTTAETEETVETEDDAPEAEVEI